MTFFFASRFCSLNYTEEILLNCVQISVDANPVFPSSSLGYLYSRHFQNRRAQRKT